MPLRRIRMEFIFMLTHNDETVPDAHAVFEQLRDSGLRYVGFKDVGLPVSELRTLASTIRASGREVFLEVVSLDREAELRSAAAALEIFVVVDQPLGDDERRAGGLEHVEAAQTVLAGNHMVLEVCQQGSEVGGRVLDLLRQEGAIETGGRAAASEEKLAQGRSPLLRIRQFGNGCKNGDMSLDGVGAD